MHHAFSKHNSKYLEHSSLSCVFEFIMEAHVNPFPQQVVVEVQVFSCQSHSTDPACTLQVFIFEE